MDRLVPKLEESLLPQITTNLATEGAEAMAMRVARTALFVLPKSISHTLVPALTHSLTHSPLTDYFCYYCYKFQEYCSYCYPSFAPAQLYYSMWYTGYYSSYYSQYYTDLHNVKIKLVREKEYNFEDPESFGAKE